MKIDYMTREKCKRELTYAKENLQRGYEFYLQGDYSNATFYINSSKTTYEWVHQVGEEFNDSELLKLSEEGLVYLKRVADEVTTLAESERQWRVVFDKQPQVFREVMQIKYLRDNDFFAEKFQ